MKQHNEPVGDRILEVRGLLHSLMALTRDIGPDTDLAEAIGMGRELWRMVELAHKRLNILKDRLRNEVDGIPGKHRFVGPDSAEGLVQVPETTPVFRKDSVNDIAKMAGLLGHTTFDTLFVRNVIWKPTKDFQAIVTGLDPSKAKVALDAVDMQTSKPRVTFIRRNP